MIEIAIILGLLTWRLTRLISIETGPFAILARFRTKVGVYNSPDLRRVGRNEIARMIICMKCLSLWVGWGVALGYTLVQGLGWTPFEVFGWGLVLSALSLAVDIGYELAVKLGI